MLARAARLVPTGVATCRRAPRLLLPGAMRPLWPRKSTATAEGVLPMEERRRQLCTTPASLGTLETGTAKVVGIVPPGGEVAAAELASWWPTGLTSQLIEQVSISGGLPWAGGIVCATLFVRMLMFPIAVKTTRNAMRMNNMYPETKLHMDRMNKCKEAGDTEGSQEAMINLQKAYSREGCNPMFGLATIVVQMPVFLSFFWALRNMSTHPIESMKAGGLNTDLWQTLQLPIDITGPDPTFLLPIATSLTMGVLLKYGSDPGTQPGMMKSPIFWAGMPLMLLGVSIGTSMPSAVFLYWLPSNAFSLTQAVLLNRVPPVQRMLNIPKRVDHGIEMPNPWGDLKKKLSEKNAEAQKIAEQGAAAANPTADAPSVHFGNKSKAKARARRRGR